MRKARRIKKYKPTTGTKHSHIRVIVQFDNEYRRYIGSVQPVQVQHSPKGGLMIDEYNPMEGARVVLEENVSRYNKKRLEQLLNTLRMNELIDAVCRVRGMEIVQEEEQKEPTLFG